jgi:16S rRNA (adenine1518-N6/adenine1519-N6)-dimethyltransferase
LILRLNKISNLITTVEAIFLRVVRAEFREKRKQLKNNLRGLRLSDEAIAAALEAAGVDGRRREETLGVEEWEKLCSLLPQL